VLTVRDDGPLDPSVTKCEGEGGAFGGVGLANTRARLARMYGDRATFHLQRTESRYTLATVELPLTRLCAHGSDDNPTNVEHPGAAGWFAREPTRHDSWLPR
jgi:hypothetical protein